MARLVRFRVLDGIAVVTMDQPPFNALTAPLRGALWEVFGRIEANNDIRAVVLMGAGPEFSAGADLREIASPPTEPTLAQLCDKIEACPKPVVAAVQGRAFGSGAELILAAHYRIALPDALIGFTEAALGLVPSGGATQRLPRLVGPQKTLDLLISTQPFEASGAVNGGLFDGTVQGDLGSGALTFVRTLLENGQGPRPTRARREHLTDGRAYLGAVASVRTSLAGTPLHAPLRVLELVEAAALMPFEVALAFEADAFARCLAHPQSIALRHIFVAERRADGALIENRDGRFVPVAPMGKSAVLRLRKALAAAAGHLRDTGTSEAEIDGALVAYGFRKGPFGGQQAGAELDIALKLVAALMGEGARMVEQGAVRRAADIDALAVHGLGYPRRLGGPMRACQTAGLLHLRTQMRLWADDSELWAVPALLDQAVKQAGGFDVVDQA